MTKTPTTFTTVTAVTISVILSLNVIFSNGAVVGKSGYDSQSFETTELENVTNSSSGSDVMESIQGIVRAVGESELASTGTSIVSKMVDEPIPTPFVKIPVIRRVYTTNNLPEFKKNRPSLYPPGFFAKDLFSRNSTILDIGANSGNDYTLRAAKAGHTVLSFEPSSSLLKNFQKIMLHNSIPLSVVDIPGQQLINENSNKGSIKTVESQNHSSSKLLQVPSSLGLDESNSNVRIVVPRDEAEHPRVYLFPIAVSQTNEQLPFYESKCSGSLESTKCGKTNRLLNDQNDRDRNRLATTTVSTFRLDDLELPVPESSIWFVKIDVEGHELEVLKGGKKFFKNPDIQYIAIEFSANGQKGTKWGTDLLDELHNIGFSCFHLRGFGKCHDSATTSPSLDCNYPFETDRDLGKAPTFKQYTKVFELTDQKEKPKMSDLMCKRRSSR